MWFKILILMFIDIPKTTLAAYELTDKYNEKLMI